MKDKLLIESIINTIPQWYSADYGPNKYTLSVSNESIPFYSQRPLTPQLRILYDYCNNNIEDWYLKLPQDPTPTSIAQIRQELVLKWLQSENPRINWSKLFSYIENLKYRTYENLPISINIIISEKKGKQDITNASFQKLLDPLASSPFVFIRVNSELEFISYEQILWSEINDTSEYKFYPEFLHPLICTLENGEYCAVLTSRGDFIVCSKFGLLASCRKGQWFVYDVSTFKNCIVGIFHKDTNNNHRVDYRVSCNLFEIMFDLSYLRHGALLVYDPNHTVINKITNKPSIITGTNKKMSEPHKLFVDDIKNIAMKDIQHEYRKKRLLLEIASLDGAVIFDQSSILAFSSMIKTHNSIISSLGARTTAALSAHRWGGYPIKISSDGDISINFTSHKNTNKDINAKLNFL